MGQAAEFEPLFDAIEERTQGRDWGAWRADVAAPHGELARELLLVLRDPTMRPEHRRRVYEDLLAHRGWLARNPDPRVVDLIVWGEHVEKLQKSLGARRLHEADFRRALVATARKCGYRVDGLAQDADRSGLLGVAWSSRHYPVVHGVLTESADLEESQPPREAAG